MGGDAGRNRANFDEHYQRDKHIVDEMLKLRLVWADRGARSYEAAIKTSYRQSACRVLELNYKSVTASTGAPPFADR